MPTIKYPNALVHRIPVVRNVEDWRQDTTSSQGGKWAIHCLQHDHRSFVRTLSEAMRLANTPSACPICEAFDLRCVYWPSDVEKWKLDSTTGFTLSAGHITGDAVCLHHQYGRIPDGIDIGVKDDPPACTNRSSV